MGVAGVIAKQEWEAWEELEWESGKKPSSHLSAQAFLLALVFPLCYRPRQKSKELVCAVTHVTASMGDWKSLCCYEKGLRGGENGWTKKSPLSEPVPKLMLALVANPKWKIEACLSWVCKTPLWVGWGVSHVRKTLVILELFTAETDGKRMRALSFVHFSVVENNCLVSLGLRNQTESSSNSAFTPLIGLSG